MAGVGTKSLSVFSFLLTEAIEWHNVNVFFDVRSQQFSRSSEALVFLWMS